MLLPWAMRRVSCLGWEDIKNTSADTARQILKQILDWHYQVKECAHVHILTAFQPDLKVSSQKHE